MTRSHGVVAAFDFDGTLTRRDTLPGFLLAACGRRRLIGPAALASPGLLRRMRRRDRDGAKELLLGATLGGRPVAELTAVAERFADGLVRGGMRSDTLGRLRAHRSDGHRVVVISASPELWVGPVAQRLGVDAVLATRLEAAGGRLTGRYDGANCRGDEKVRRLDEWLDGADVELHAYGNSAGDAALLTRADHATLVPRRLPAG